MTIADVVSTIDAIKIGDNRWRAVGEIEKFPGKEPASKSSWLQTLPSAMGARLTAVAKFLTGEGSYYFDVLSERRRLNKGREIIATGVATELVKRFGEKDEAAERLLARHVDQLLAEDENLTSVFDVAIDDLQGKPSHEFDQRNDINPDWLHQFRRLAKEASSSGMRAGFSKILSGEMANPGSFSPLTLQRYSTLGREAAIGLRSFASVAITGRAFEPQVFTLDLDPMENEMEGYDLSRTSLFLMQEHGLLSSTMEVSTNFYERIFQFPFLIGGKPHRATSTSGRMRSRLIPMKSLVLTQTGRELLKIADPIANIPYIENFDVWLRDHLSMKLERIGVK